MCRTFCWAILVVAMALGMSGMAQAQVMMGGNDWLKQSVPIPAGTPGYGMPGVANPMDGLGNFPKTDWVRDLNQGTGMFAPNANMGGSGFTKQTNGPTTTYTWYWGQPSYGSRAVGNQAAATMGNSMVPVTPTLMNPQFLAGFYPGAAVVRVRGANPYAPYQYTVQPVNSVRPINFGR